MIGLGHNRYFNQIGDESNAAPGRYLVENTVGLLTAALEQFMVDVAKGYARNKSVAAEYLEELDLQAVAAITTKVCVNHLSLPTPTPIATVAMRAANAVQQHFDFTEFMRGDPGLWKVVQRKLAHCTSGRHRAAVIRRYMTVTEASGLGWSDRDRALLGMKLLELFIDTTGLATKYMKFSGKKRLNVFQATPEVVEWLAARHDDAAYLSPMFLPMVVKPDPWTTPLDGGYLTKGLGRVTLVKTHRRESIDELFNADMPEVYDAVNAVQSTAWRISRPVYDVMKALADEGSALGGLPAGELTPLPPRLAGIPENVRLGDLTKEQQAALKAWKGAKARAHEERARELSKRVALKQQLFVAAEFVDEEAIYFPHTLDFRGRIYPVPGILHPQSDDRGRALLEFAEGKPLGEFGAGWLAVHIANLFGYDKATFDERVEWVNEHSEQLLDSAANPMDGERFWTQADKPWCALAACFEYAGYMVEGDDYVSHLPIAMDGTCSGLQHFSALLRDPVGAKAVNLVQPEDGRKADIYQEVADAVELRLKASQVADDPVAQAWAGKVDRKIVKRPCMTYAYSVSQFGIKQQIQGELDAMGEDALGVSNHVAAQFLTPLVLDAIKGTVKAAARAMKWLQNTVRTASEAGPVVWTSPVGLPVWQDERKQQGQRVELIFQGQRTRVSLTYDTSQIDSVAQRNAIAPNYIHSMDAAHLVRTVNGCVARGLTSFSMIHDSFGVHACDVDTLHYTLRLEFKEMYQSDNLAILREQIVSALPKDLAGDIQPPPKMGDLDLEEVLSSDFFFC